jgi:lysophospholipase L1-like esterase
VDPGACPYVSGSIIFSIMMKGGHRRRVLLLVVVLLVAAAVAALSAYLLGSSRNRKERTTTTSTSGTTTNAADVSLVDPDEQQEFGGPAREGAVGSPPSTSPAMMLTMENDDDDEDEVEVEERMNLCLDPLLDEQDTMAILDEGCACAPAWQPVRRDVADDNNPNWARHHQHLKEAAAYFGGGQRGGVLDVVWLGDSLVEFMNGTHLSAPVEAARRGNPDVFRRAFDDHGLRAIAVGSAGDTTNNLLYHLHNGVYEPLRQTKVWIITAGTNNMGITDCSRNSTYNGIVALVRYLKDQNADSIVVVHGLLPRGGPRQSSKYNLGRYWDWIVMINAQLKAYCDDESVGGGGDCVYTEAQTKWFIMDADGDDDSGDPRQQIRSDTMSDALHPDTSGYKLWIPTIAATVRELLEERGRI